MGWLGLFGSVAFGAEPAAAAPEAADVVESFRSLLDFDLLLLLLLPSPAALVPDPELPLFPPFPPFPAF